MSGEVKVWNKTFQKELGRKMLGPEDQEHIGNPRQHKQRGQAWGKAFQNGFGKTIG